MQLVALALLLARHRAAAPPAPLPSWAGPRPDAAKGPAHGLPTIAGAETSTVYTGAHDLGTYSHGPMITWWDGPNRVVGGHYYISWYNAPQSEALEMRVLMSTSRDGKAWARPSVLFSNLTKEGSTYGTQNEAYCQHGGRLYGVASAYDYCSTSRSSSTHGRSVYNPSCLGTSPAPHYEGPYNLLMRQILSPTELGEIFWLQPARGPPAGYARYNFRGYLDMPEPARSDAAFHLTTLVNTSVPSMQINDTDHIPGVPYPLTYQGERSLYHLPGEPSRLQLLIRTWKPSSRGFLWGSSCTLPAEAAAQEKEEAQQEEKAVPSVPMGWCAAGTGANMLQVLDGGGSSGSGAVASEAGAAASSAFANCSWSTVAETDIPDAGSRTCAAQLPADFAHSGSGRKGGVWLIANSAKNRLTLVLSLSSDGLVFDRHFVVRDSASAKPIRFPGGGKSPGFQVRW